MEPAGGNFYAAGWKKAAAAILSMTVEPLQRLYPSPPPGGYLALSRAPEDLITNF